MSNHYFKASLQWNLKSEADFKSKKIYTKNHTISFEGKESISVSAAKVFKGDPTLVNPEDLLLSSVTSCHMMSYLYVCQQNNIEILSYQDHSEAILEVNSDGSGKITKIILNPTIKIKDESKIDLAISLHKKANQLCFIANSCNFPILHHPSVYAED